ncbi:hypothetical protein QX776_14125 [Alteromonadaceae bacterium BrNp21-10]|nr:hypothetical protein [Alteromonadaceae bacterium BrNp21-10]
MKTWLYRLGSPLRYLSSKRQGVKAQLKQQMLRIKAALRQETAETKIMLKTYRKYTQGTASYEEMQLANLQFVELVKSLGIGVVAVLPFSPITIPLAIKLGRWVGVDILPSSLSTSKKPPAPVDIPPNNP